MRIGIYGGTFNPVHNGHINILKGFYKELKLDKLLVIPTKIPPHKVAKDLASEDDRLKMLELSLSDLDMNVEISDIEIKAEGKSFTYLTLEKLGQIYPDDEFYLLMGEDMFLIIDKWRNSEYIMKTAVICGSPRSNDGFSKMTDFAEELSGKLPYFKYRIVDIPFVDVSSTEIRECAKEHDQLLKFVPEKAADYIVKNKLYTGV